eukprot:scaffold626_cov337-Pavlova_lutheri.AAC.24
MWRSKGIDQTIVDFTRKSQRWNGFVSDFKCCSFDLRRRNDDTAATVASCTARELRLEMPYGLRYASPGRGRCSLPSRLDRSRSEATIDASCPVGQGGASGGGGDDPPPSWCVLVRACVLVPVS